MNTNFEAKVGGTVSRTVSGTSASVSAPALGGAKLCRLHLTGATAVAFVRFGDGSATATSADIPVINNIPVEVVVPAYVANGTPYVAAIGSDGTLYITPGNPA